MGRLTHVQDVPLLGNFLFAFFRVKGNVILIIGRSGLNPDGDVFYSILT